MALKDGKLLRELLEFDDAHDTNVIVYGSGAFLLAVTSCLALLMAPVICSTSVTKSKCMLGLYVTVAICVLTCITTGAALIYAQDVNEEYLSEPLLATMNKYDEDSVLKENEDVVSIWTEVMEVNECCGVDNFSDWRGVDDYGENHPKAFFVPAVCCTNIDEWDGNQEQVDECRRHPDTMSVAFNELDGCVDEFVAQVEHNQDRVFFTSLSLIISMFINVCAAAALLCSLKK